MNTEFNRLRIDRTQKRPPALAPRVGRWMMLGIAVAGLLSAGYMLYDTLHAAPEVEIARVRVAFPSPGGEGGVLLNATGYIVAAHKIELASKVVGKVAWIGVEKGDKVQEGQALVRLEDDEYRARLLEAQGQLSSFKARLAQLENGSRPEEIAKAKADLEQAHADLENAQVTLQRTRALVARGVLAKQTLDDAQARYNAQAARVAALGQSYTLVRLGPRREEIEAMRAQVTQAQGTLAFAQTQVENTIIRAPIAGTILARNVEKGEFVTTGFVGDKGAKGYVVSLADLNHLQVELDINQNDFAKLGLRQPGIVTTDAYADRKYRGVIEEIAPEANRQKATVQVKVKILNPDSYLRLEMNANVAFYEPEKPGYQAGAQPLIIIPASAVRDHTVFVVVDGKAVRHPVQVSDTTPQGVRIVHGLMGGEDLMLHPPADLQDGQTVRPKPGSQP